MRQSPLTHGSVSGPLCKDVHKPGPLQSVLLPCVFQWWDDVLSPEECLPPVSFLPTVSVMINVTALLKCFSGDVCLLTVYMKHLKKKNMETEGPVVTSVGVTPNGEYVFRVFLFAFSFVVLGFQGRT